MDKTDNIKGEYHEGIDFRIIHNNDHQPIMV